MPCLTPSPTPLYPRAALVALVLPKFRDMSGLSLKSTHCGRYQCSSSDLHSRLGLVKNIFPAAAWGRVPASLRRTRLNYF